MIKDIRGDIIYSDFIKSCSLENLDDYITYSIIHINPLVNNDKYDYINVNVSFASDFIKQVLECKYKNSLHNMNAILINSDALNDSKKIDTISKSFELYFITEMINDTITLDLKCLHLLDQPNLSLTIDAKFIIFEKGRSSLNLDDINKLIIPESKTFESADLFYLDSSNGENVLYFFQVTTAKSHSVNQAGLVYIENLYNKLDVEISKFVLIFVVPLYSSLNSKQKINIISPPTDQSLDVQPRIRKRKQNFFDDVKSSKIDPNSIHQYLLKFECPLKDIN